MKLTNNIFGLTDVDLIVEHLSDILQKGIIIEDANFELVAYSSPNEFSFDPIQQKTILSKRCPLYIMERLKKDGIVDRLKTEERPIRLESMEDVKFYQRIVISIKYNNKIYGYLWIYESDESFDEEVFSYLTKIAPHIGKLLYEREINYESINQYQASSFLWKLLNDDFINSTAIQREANIASFPLPENFSIMVASIREPNYIYILNKLKQLFTKENVSFHLGKGTEIICIIDFDQIEKVDEFINLVRETLTEDEQLNLYIGIGNKQKDVSNIRASYLQALEVVETLFFLNVNQQDDQFLCFKDLGIAKFAKQMYKKNVDEQYRHDDIKVLLQVDEENNSELTKTVWEYIRNDGKVKQTADQLFIHPNTLNYRLKQINELTSIDFDNVHRKVDLYIELFLIYYISDYFEHYMQVLN